MKVLNTYFIFSTQIVDSYNLKIKKKLKIFIDNLKIFFLIIDKQIFF